MLVPPTLVVGTPCVGGLAGAVAEGAAEGCTGCSMGRVAKGTGAAVAVGVANGEPPRMPVPVAGTGTFWEVIGVEPRSRVAVARGRTGTPLSPGWAPKGEGRVPGGAVCGVSVLCGTGVSVKYWASPPPGWELP